MKKVPYLCLIYLTGNNQAHNCIRRSYKMRLRKRGKSLVNVAISYASSPLQFLYQGESGIKCLNVHNSLGILVICMRSDVLYYVLYGRIQVRYSSQTCTFLPQAVFAMDHWLEFDSILRLVQKCTIIDNIDTQIIQNIKCGNGQIVLERNNRL